MKKPNIAKCCKCDKKLARVDVERAVCVCLTFSCPNYSLLCLPQDTIDDFINNIPEKDDS